jgi:hypothetical protein
MRSYGMYDGVAGSTRRSDLRRFVNASLEEDVAVGQIPVDNERP